jgi:putative spermidine/putrescine transport system permease protein
MSELKKSKSFSFWTLSRAVICGFVILYMLVPLAIVIAISFSSAPFLTFPPPGLSLQWYRAISDPAWSSALATTAIVMFPAAALATSLGLGAALMLHRPGFPFAGPIRAFLMSPLVVPVIITGAAIYGVFRSLGLYGTLLGLILADTVLSVPYALATISASLQMVDPSLAQAAASLGSAPMRTFWRITFPMVRAGVFSSFLFSLVVSFDELVVSLFISSPDARPITVQMWSNIRGDVDPTIAALATLLFLFALSILLIEAVFGRGQTDK